MKITWKGTVLSAIAVLSLGSAHALQPTKLIKGKITKVVDGDTVWFEPNGATKKEDTLKVRMVGMDTPETHLPSPHGVVGQQPWGDSAADHLAKLLPVGTKATLEDHGRDSYQRTLGRLVLKNTDINLQQVVDGWASPYIICEGQDCNEDFFENENVEGYLAACEEARTAGRGIYNRKNPLDELPFEFRIRMGDRVPDKWVGDYHTKELFDPADYEQVDECARVFFMRKGDALRAGYAYSTRGRH